MIDFERGGDNADCSTLWLPQQEDSCAQRLAAPPPGCFPGAEHYAEWRPRRAAGAAQQMVRDAQVIQLMAEVMAAVRSRVTRMQCGRLAEPLAGPRPAVEGSAPEPAGAHAGADGEDGSVALDEDGV
eukprot:1307813-Prymnesium_polylepis.1